MNVNKAPTHVIIFSESRGDQSYFPSPGKLNLDSSSSPSSPIPCTVALAAQLNRASWSSRVVYLYPKSYLALTRITFLRNRCVLYKTAPFINHHWGNTLVRSYCEMKTASPALAIDRRLPHPCNAESAESRSPHPNRPNTHGRNPPRTDRLSFLHLFVCNCLELPSFGR
jgi:hypothetical protein